MVFPQKNPKGLRVAFVLPTFALHNTNPEGNEILFRGSLFFVYNERFVEPKKRKEKNTN